MGTKTNPGSFDGYAAAEADEPIFVLLARDPDAPRLVELWASMRAEAIRRGEKPTSDHAKVEEARQTAEAMSVWRIRREIRKGAH